MQRQNSEPLHIAWTALGGLAAAKILLHLFAIGHYGYFRDELYYLASTDDLAWGYVDHPPFSIALLAAHTALGIAFATVAIMLILSGSSRANYLALAYPLIIAPGAVALERGEYLIIIGGDPSDYAALFKSFAHMTTIECARCMPYERDLPVYLCRKLKVPLAELWPQLKNYN